MLSPEVSADGRAGRTFWKGRWRTSNCLVTFLLALTKHLITKREKVYSGFWLTAQEKIFHQSEGRPRSREGRLAGHLH